MCHHNRIQRLFPKKVMAFNNAGEGDWSVGTAQKLQRFQMVVFFFKLGAFAENLV